MPGDSSGRMSYVQVRYPGFEVSPGNELNGITLAGVGSGTFFQNIQVHNSSDDGVEWFGGRVNGKNLVMTGERYHVALYFGREEKVLPNLTRAAAEYVVKTVAYYAPKQVRYTGPDDFAPTVEF